MELDSVRELGMLLLQAFQKLPGFMYMFGDAKTLSTLQLICGILTIVSFVVGIGLVIVGVAKFAVKRVENERTGGKDPKSGLNYLIGGITGGSILIMLPSILLIIGSVFGAIATS